MELMDSVASNLSVRTVSNMESHLPNSANPERRCKATYIDVRGKFLHDSFHFPQAFEQLVVVDLVLGLLEYFSGKQNKVSYIMNEQVDK